MIITYLGVEFFKIQQGDITIALNPISKDSKFKTSHFGADVALSSLNHPDMNGTEQMIHGDKVPLTITGPGEYETKGIFIKGFPSSSKYGGKEGINTIYLIALENINLCFLGALDTVELPKEVSEALDDIDVLFLPIGGEGVLDAAGASKLSVKLEPKIIIPMHFGDIGKAGALKAFLKEAGVENGKAEEKLTLKKKDLEGKEEDVVVLAAQS